jgi:diguanylate cyclase (GGDEF)-like protein
LLGLAITAAGINGLPLVALLTWLAVDSGVRLGARYGYISGGVAALAFTMCAFLASNWEMSAFVSTGIGINLVLTIIYVVGFKVKFERARCALDEQAMHDALTGLHNRDFFSEHLKRLMQITRRNRLYIACIFVDLDGFKAVNDTWGHATGDRLLQEVARLLRAGTRESDLIGRMGGDEFAIATDCMRIPQDAIIVARRILNSIQQLDGVDGHPIRISASIGISWFIDDSDDEGNPDTDALINNADQAMYAAKHGGKAAIVMVDPIGRFTRVDL